MPRTVFDTGEPELGTSTESKEPCFLAVTSGHQFCVIEKVTFLNTRYSQPTDLYSFSIALLFLSGAYNQTDGDLEIHHHPRKQHGNGEKQEACNKKLSPIKEEALLTEHVSQKQGLSAKLSAGERVLQSIQQPEGNRSGTEHCGRRRVNRKESDKQQLPNTVETHDANFQR